MLRKLLGLMIALWSLTSCDDGPTAPETRVVALESLVTGDVSVVLDPNGITPLAAQITLQTRTATEVSLTVLGDPTISHRFQGQVREHSVQLLGLYPGVENRVVLRVTDYAASVFALDTLSVTTPPLPEFLPSVDVQIADPRRVDCRASASAARVRASLSSSG